MGLATVPPPTSVQCAVKSAWWCDIALAAAHLPLVIFYWARLAALPHYQFFPLALAGSALLAHRAARSNNRPTSLAPGPYLAFGAGLSVLLVAILLISPWLGYAAALVNYTAWLRLRVVARFRDAWPAVIMAAVTLRLPMGLDLWLIRKLQQITAQAADAVLDVLGVLHTLAGNIIEVPGRPLLIEEACSGVNSLFSATACVIFYVLWSGRGWISSSLLMLSIPLWVVFANVLRVVLTAWLRVRWNISADEGLLHDALGLATFSLAVGLLVSTERLIRFYGDVIVKPTPLSAPPATRAVDERSSRLGWTSVGIAAAMLSLVQVPAFAIGVDRLYSDWRFQAPADFGEQGLDAQIDEWQRMDYETVERDRNSPFGRRSQSWTFARDQVRAIVSLDYPFQGWHELTECYETQGWRVISREVLPLDDAGAGVSVTLRHDMTERDGRLFFALLSSDGQAYSVRTLGEIDEWYDRLRLRFSELSSARQFAAQKLETITFQHQTFIATYLPLTAAEDAAARRLFAASHAQIRRRIGEAAAASGGAP